MFASKVIVSAFLATLVSAAAVDPRQLAGGLACNIARLQIVNALGSTEDAVAQIQDPATASAAQAGLDQANGGISEIASAIVAGDAPPDSGRAEVEAGLQAVGSALDGADA